MQRVLVIYYSQSGQTLAAVRTIVETLKLDADFVDLDALELPQPFPFPWRLSDFFETQWLAFHPPSDTTGWPSLDLQDYYGVLLAYPVWYLSPAVPMSAWLLSLPPNALVDRHIVTVSTCRNMWFRGQVEMRRLVESRGGRVAAHLCLQDSSSSGASLVTTPHYFLTGKKSFDSPLFRRIFGEFGIKQQQYVRLQRHLEKAQATGLAGIESAFMFSSRIAVAEILGRRISQIIVWPWPWMRKSPRAVQLAYLYTAAAITACLIILLLPLTLVVCSLPPLPSRLRSLQRQVVSGDLEMAPQGGKPTQAAETRRHKSRPGGPDAGR